MTGCTGFREPITTAKAQRGIVVNRDTGTPVIGAVVTSKKGDSSRQTEVDQSGEFVLDSYQIRHNGDAIDDAMLAAAREPLLIRASSSGFYPAEMRFVNGPNTLDTIFPDRIVIKLQPKASLQE
ncbi:hypothetical protein HAHE_16310 [Haloferula helveola]|uniref:Carboxypeptidase regulatory-like domain-containing protein n=2 Tax=Haloferula helveola TaxID=490095 RepID=A0ABM7RD42_9BACT|nr:hypothetical protein HAHE_16310 [Haloferula helveola]